jgi:hypothetical protein
VRESWKKFFFSFFFAQTWCLIIDLDALNDFEQFWSLRIFREVLSISVVKMIFSTNKVTIFKIREETGQEDISY